MAEVDSTPAGRHCTKCGEFKVWESFCRSSRGLRGRNSKCRDCVAAYQAENLEKLNKVKLARYHRLQRPIRVEKAKRLMSILASPCKRCAKCGYEKLKSEFSADNTRVDGLKPYCRECRRSEAARWRDANPGRLLQLSNAWKEKNPERAKILATKHRSKLKNRLHATISSRIYALLKGKGGQKTLDVLGYSIRELSLHLEKQFTRGMSWANYGDWHIDHIVPLSSFRITSMDDPELRRAWALSNLRPLWAKENLKKNAKRTYLL